MKIVKYLLFKYLRFDKTQPFITLTAVLAFLGVCIGLMVLIIAMAIMNGFDKEFERKLFTMNYPITILSFNKGGIDNSDISKLKKEFPSLLFSPYIVSQAISKSDNKLEGGVIFGVDYDKESKINSVLAKSINGNKFNTYNIILGSGMLSSLGLQKGEKATIIFTQSSPSGFSLIPKMKRFDVKNTFHSGLIAYDRAYMYTSLQALRNILDYKPNTYDGIHVYSKDPFSDINRIKKVLPTNLRAIGWWQQNGNFFSALKLEKRALFIVLMLIILIAALNIVSSLLMTVMNRRSEIALLLSLGVSKKEIKYTFFSLGGIIGGGGIVVGSILGLFGIWLLGNFDIISLPADVYGSSKLPLELSFIDFAMIIIGAIIIVALSSYYPAKKATQINVLNTLRNE